MNKKAFALCVTTLSVFTAISCNKNDRKDEPIIEKSQILSQSEIPQIIEEWQASLRSSKVVRPTNPIERFAEYNVAEDGKTFATTHACSASGYFTIEEAQAISITDDKGNEYVLPSAEDWDGISNYENELLYGLMGEFRRNQDEKLTVNGVQRWYKEDRYSPGKGVLYVLRYKKHTKSGNNPKDNIPYAADNEMLTAYKYERIPSQYPGENGYLLKITARYLGPSFRWGIEVVANEGFWHSYTKDDVVMTLPATGVKIARANFRLSTCGTIGEYWNTPQTQSDGSIKYWTTGFGKSFFTQTAEATEEDKRAVRLVRKEK